MKIQITDINSPDLELFAKYSESELKHIYEPDPGLFLAESPKVIDRALAAGYEPVAMLVSEHDYEGEAAETIRKCESAYRWYAEEATKEANQNAEESTEKADRDSVNKDIIPIPNFPVYTAPDDILEQVTGYKLIRGAICIMKRKSATNRHVRFSEGKGTERLSKMLDKFTRIAVLEDVTNPTNLGAIFRSAAALGIEAVLLTPGCADPLYRRTLRTGMGTVFQVPWSYIGESLEDWNDYGVDLLHELGFKTAAMALKEDSVSIDDNALEKEDRLAIILGNEGHGLCDNTIDKSDYTVLIPMTEGVDSLNVAAASAVAFWQLCGHRKR